MTSRAWDRAQRRSSTVGALAVLAVLAAVVTTVAMVGVPDVWWPHIGSAFAASPPHPAPSTASADPCALIAGPARDFCAAPPAASPAQPHGMGADAWRLLVPAVGVVLVCAVRCSGRRRS
ncbi:hypothetical protein ACIBCO_36890 [Streptomyces violascens]|uniref:hypothetical protein n=1 Tax=Streptomyces violascens TaxID=67381 RepID=UPI0037B55B28